MDSKAGTQSMERLHYTTGGSDNKMPLVLGVIALLLAVIGVIVAAIGLSRSNRTNNIVINGAGGGAQAEDNVMYEDNKIWVFAIGHSAAKTEYLDEVSGQIKGYNVDIVYAVCKIAHKNCKFTVDVYTNCWDSKAGESQRGGIGIYSKYYDACTAWIQSYVRRRTFQFTDPFADNPADVAFIVKPGNNFDWRDITGKTIGFQDGWFADEFCLARDPEISGTPLPAANIKHYVNREDMLAAVLDGSVDAAFDTKSVWGSVDEVDIVDGHLTDCAAAGRSMMMRKDSRMWEWWNPAFEILVKSPEYQTICKDLLEQHGHIPGPTPEQLCFNYRK